jgi:hypothetical protein
LSLEIDEDLPLQRVQWMVERVLWVVMAGVVLAALLGLLGAGPISLESRSSSDSSIEATYDRFGRLGSSLALDLTLRPQVGGEQVEVAISGDYLEKLRLEGVTPEPAEVRTDGDDLIFAFTVAESAEQVDATFNFTVEGMGPSGGEIGIPDGEAISIAHFFYP